jgi:O-succinylbenzoic acid--CoA ligase
MTVVDPLRETRADPESVALIGAERVWTYRDLDRAVDGRVDALMASGRARGQVVPSMVDANADFVIELLALWRLGATPAPLNAKLTEPEREAARAALEHAPAGAQAILWTSGTAGRPRGVVLSFAALRASAHASAERLGLRADDVWLASLSPAHVGGLALITRALLLGSSLVAVGPFEAARTWGLMRGGGHLPGVAVPVTHASLVPTQLLRLLDLSAGEPPPASLRCVLVGGAGTPRDLLARALAGGWPVALTYGLTEATSQVATASPEQTRLKPGSVGRPLAGVAVRLGEGDEILVRGQTMAAGYVGPGVGSLVDAEGWHHTGDMGRIDPDGDLWVIGRRADRIISGGVTIDAVEVEEALRSHPAVADACVVGIADAEWGERVAAWIEPAGEAPDPRALDAYLRARLAAPKLPRRYHVEPNLPRNVNGKLDRGAVRERLSRTG